MRLRNIKGAEQFIADSKYVIQNPEDYLGKWNTFFENDHPLHIEIGMGKGKFIHTLASQNPSVNYLGIEMYSSVLYRAIENGKKWICQIYILSVWMQKISVMYFAMAKWIGFT